jgi:hypothetical protein
MTVESTTEEWKGIPGFEGLYEASTEGRIRRTRKPLKNSTSPRTRLLQPILHETGYDRVHLSKESYQKPYRLHRLIARTFLPDYTETLHVDHKNGVKTDNRLSNLRMASRSQNNANTTKKASKSGWRGVYPQGRGFSAQCKFENKTYCLLYSRNPEDCAKAVDRFRLNKFGEFAHSSLNFPLDTYKNENM